MIKQIDDSDYKNYVKYMFELYNKNKHDILFDKSEDNLIYHLLYGNKPDITRLVNCLETN